MTVTVEAVVREFKHGSLALEDPDPSQTPEEVKAFYAAIYPELTNAEIETERKGAKTVYTFRRAVGTKGADRLTLRDRLEAQAGGKHLEQPRGHVLTAKDVEACAPIARAFALLCCTSRSGETLVTPTELLPPLP